MEERKSTRTSGTLMLPKATSRSVLPPGASAENTVDLPDPGYPQIPTRIALLGPPRRMLTSPGPPVQPARAAHGERRVAMDPRPRALASMRRAPLTWVDQGPCAEERRAA